MVTAPGEDFGYCTLTEDLPDENCLVANCLGCVRDDYQLCELCNEGFKADFDENGQSICATFAPECDDGFYGVYDESG